LAPPPKNAGNSHDDMAEEARASSWEAAMRLQRQIRNIFAIGFVALIAESAMPTPAQAQWGGGGWGWGGFSQVPKPESYLNQKSLVDAARGSTAPSRDVYANNPNAYINHVRDNGFVLHYRYTTREPSHYPESASPKASTPAPAAAQPQPVLPLASFYGPDGKIEWLAEAPTAGDLGERRGTFDLACQAVLDDVKKNSIASFATATDARRKLLDYGRPALQYVRTHETPRVSDAFHMFLLSLYRSLAQAVNPPAAAGAATPAASGS
jgi:hypothetical protein